MTSKEFYISIASIVLALTVLGISTLMGLLDKENIWMAFILIIVYAVLISGLMFLYHRTIKYRDVFVTREIIGQVKNISQSSDPWWVVRKDEIKELEESSKEVWIITPDFYFDYNDPTFQKIVEQNIIAGKKYKYLYPEDKEPLANALKNKFNKINPSHNTDFICVPGKTFGIIGFEIALYDPLDPISAYHKGIFVDILSERKKSNPNWNDFVDVYLVPIDN